MRKIFDNLYYFSAVAAGFCLAAMTALILCQIVGRWFGVVIPSTEDFSGYLVAGAFSLGLAYSFRRGALIIVTLLISNLTGKVRFLMEFVAISVMAALSLFLVWYFGYIVYESYIYKELTQGYIPILLWIPQMPVFIGLIIFSIAIVDDLIQLLCNGEPSYKRCEEEAGATHSE